MNKNRNDRPALLTRLTGYSGFAGPDRGTRQSTNATIPGGAGFLVALGWLLLVCLVLNWSALSGNWRWDDSAILLHLHQFSSLADFISPATWQSLSRTNLMPWLPLSFEVDLVLFGLNPVLFYVHHLVSLAACAAVLYLLLARLTGGGAALFGASLFLAGAPVLVVAQQLMTRHYIEGLLFCLLSLFFYTLHAEKRCPGYLAVSVLCYGLAVVAKEIYVPLVILLIFLPAGNNRERAITAMPFVAVAALYTVWRGYMLGDLLGGYTEQGVFMDPAFMPEVLSTFTTFPGLLFGSAWPVVIVLYGLLAVMSGFQSRQGMRISLIVLLLLLLPLVPLVRNPGIASADRYLFLPWAAFCFSAGYFSHRLAVRFFKSGSKALQLMLTAVALALIGTTAVHGLQMQGKTAATGAEFDSQAELIWNNDDSIAFIPSPSVTTSFWFVSDLILLKERLVPGSSAPEVVPDPIYLGSSGSTLLEYDADCRCMVDISNTIDQRRESFRTSLHADAPLEVEYRYQGGFFSWRFGPYDTGSYRVVSDILGVFPVGAAGQLGATLRPNAPFYVRYTSPRGWTTYSDELTINHDAPTYRWER